MKLARFGDEWRNIWWLFERSSNLEKPIVKENSDLSWQDKNPSLIYTSLMDTMKNLNLK